MTLYAAAEQQPAAAAGTLCSAKMIEAIALIYYAVTGRRDEHARVLARHITICVDFDGPLHARRSEDLEELLRNGRKLQ